MDLLSDARVLLGAVLVLGLVALAAIAGIVVLALDGHDQPAALGNVACGCAAAICSVLGASFTRRGQQPVAPPPEPLPQYAVLPMQRGAGK